MVDLKIFNSVDKISEYTFGMLIKAGNTALSFGSTYDAIFRRWKELYLQKTSADSGAPAMPSFFPADERLVDFDDPGSNWGTAWKTFLSDCGTAADKLRWASDIKTYGSFLRGYFGTETAERPVFDLIFLGIGPDGHTASLFPGDCPVSGEPEWFETVLRTKAPFTPPNRLTLGPEVIASAERLVIVVTGVGKSEIFSRMYGEIISGGNEKPLPPVRIIKRREELKLDTEILCDNPAAEKLGKEMITEHLYDF